MVLYVMMYKKRGIGEDSYNCLREMGVMVIDYLIIFFESIKK